METLLAAHRLVLLAALAFFCSRVASVRRPPEASPGPTPIARFALAIGVLFGVLFAGQAFWSRAAAAVPAFRRVEKHDARLWRLSSPADRRAVVDRRGHPLIVSVADAGEVRRRYPLGTAAGHLTGYLDRRYGRAGLEAACDELLATWRQPAWETLKEGAQRPAEAGPAPLVTTIDASLQQVAARALGRRPGAVVVLNPAAGDVLALVSSPTFDPNRVDPATFSRLVADPASPLLNRALAGLYPPGSAFKPLVAAAALERGVAAGTVHETSPDGFLAPYDTKRIKEHEAGESPGWRGPGPLTMAQATERSSNGYFAWLGTALGAQPMVDMAVRLGLVEAWDLVGSGFDLTAAAGSLPSRRLKPGDTARLAIGQDELLVTPLGLATAFGTLANYGVRVAPHLLPLKTAPVGEPTLDAELAATVQDLLRGPVEGAHGTCRGLRGLGVPVAAKTGSAQNPHGVAHAWLACFAPATAATVVVVVLVENGGAGSTAALPVAREVLRQAGELGYFAAVKGDA